MRLLDEGQLDDQEALEAADPGAMLRAVATSGAQVRAAVSLTPAEALQRVAGEGRPRAVIVAGMGGSGISGDVLATVAGPGCPVPILVERGYQLPGWVGPMDLVVAVSCSGSTEETLAVAAEAVRRGSALVGVGAARSPLADIVTQSGSVLLPVDAGGRLPRANLWALSVPLLLLADALHLAAVPAAVLEATADVLDRVSETCRPASESFVNPAKTLGLELAGSLPLVWGGPGIGALAAYRLGCQLNENAKYPVVVGMVPEAQHNQVVALDGPFGRGSVPDAADFFRDRGEDEEETRLRLVLLRDPEEHAQVARRMDVAAEIAQERGVPVTVLRAEGEHSLERLASLVGLVDFASVYCALALGMDPTPIDAITELKERIVR